MLLHTSNMTIMSTSPGAHVVHEVWALSLDEVPMLQLVHTEDPDVMAKVPAKHGLHTLAEVAPTVVEKEPIGHLPVQV